MAGTRLKPAAAASVLLSLLLHAALLAAPPAARPQEGAGRPPAMRVRTLTEAITAPQAQPPRPPDDRAGREPARSRTGRAGTTMPAWDLPTAPTAAGPPVAGPSDDPAAPNEGESESEDGLGDFLAPEQLDRRARASASIDLPWPELAPHGRFRAVMTLFVDETGQVLRVRLEPDEAGTLPPVLEDSARQAFLAGRFEPGELGGRAVRSRLRVEVEFRDD